MKKTLLLAAWLCTALAAGAQESGLRTEEFVRHIEKYGQQPLEYIADKVRRFRCVGIGEDHWVKDQPLYFCEILRYLETDPATHVDAVCLEFGNSGDARLADSLLCSPEYDPRLVHAILADAPDTYGSPYREYAEIFRTLWELNKDKPAGEKTRIVLLDPTWMRSGKPGFESPSRDESMFHLLRSCLRRHRHVLFYAGQAHTMHHTRGYAVGSYSFNELSAGGLLKAAYPDDYFAINLWGAFMHDNGYIAREQGTGYVEIAGGIIDEAFRRNGDRPVAFDIGTPDFPAMTESDYFTLPPYRAKWPATSPTGSPFTERTLLRDALDGIVFFKPVRDYSGATLIDIYDEQKLRMLRERSGNPELTSERILSQYKAWRPMLDDSQLRPAQ